LAQKRGKPALNRHIFKTILTSVTKTISLSHVFIFEEFEKSLTMDSVRDVLLDQFNECEETRSLSNLFIFREFEKRLTMDSMGVPFS
jgi:hypothetical protein